MNRRGSGLPTVSSNSTSFPYIFAILWLHLRWEAGHVVSYLGSFLLVVSRVWDAKGVVMVIDHYLSIYRRHCFRLAAGGKARAEKSPECEEICRACAGSSRTKLEVCGSCNRISMKINTLPPSLSPIPWYNRLACVPPSCFIKPVYVMWFHPYYNSK